MSVAIVNGNYYDTLPEALNAVEAGGIVTLLEEVRLDSTLEIDKSVVFELATWKIIGNIVVKGSAEVTFRGGQMTAESGDSVIDVQDEAKLNLDNMDVTGGETINGRSAIQAIVYQSTGALNITDSQINGGSVTHDETCTVLSKGAAEAITASRESGGTITIENSVIEGGKGNTDATPTGKYDSNLFVCGAVAFDLSGNASVEVKNSTIHGGDSDWYHAGDALNVAVFEGALSISDNSVISGGDAYHKNGNWGDGGQGIRVTLNAGACKQIDITDSWISGGAGLSEGEGVSLYKNVPMNIENSTISAGGNGAGCITFMTMFATEYDVTLKDVTLDGAADANGVIQYQTSDKAEGIKIAGELTIAGGTLEDVTFSDVEAGTVIKTTGTGTVDNSTVFADNAVAIFDDETGEYKFESVDKSTLLVNADWTGKARGDKIDGHEGYYSGVNAFGSLNDASKALTGEDVEIVLSGDEPILADSVDIKGNVTLSGNAVIQRNGYNFLIGYENGDGKLTIAEGAELDFTNKGSDGSNGFVVSDGRTKNGVTDRYHGELFIDNAHVKASYLCNRNITTISGDDVAISETANLSVSNGFIIGSRLEEETGDTNVATVTINKKASVEVGGSNWVEIGNEGAGALVVDDAKFVTNQLVTVAEGSRIQLTDAEFSATHKIENKGTVAVSGAGTLNINTLTGNSLQVVADATLTDSAIGGNVSVGFDAENAADTTLTLAGTTSIGGALYVGRENRTNDYKLVIAGEETTVKLGSLYSRTGSTVTVSDRATLDISNYWQSKGTVTVDASTITLTGHNFYIYNNDSSDTAAIALMNGAVLNHINASSLTLGSTAERVSGVAKGNASVTLEGGSALQVNHLYLNATGTVEEVAGAEAKTSLTAVDSTVTARGEVGIGTGATVSLDSSEFTADTLTNNGTFDVSGESTVNINSVTGNSIQLNGTLKDSKIVGEVKAFASSTIKDSTIKEIYFTAENGESVNGTIEGSVSGVNLAIDRRVNDEVVETVTGKAVVKSGAQVVLSPDADGKIGHIWNKIGSELVIEKDAEVQLYGELQNKGAITVSGTLAISAGNDGDNSVKGTGATLAGGAANSYDSVGTMTIDGGKLSFTKDTWAYVGGCNDSGGDHIGPEGSKLVIQNEGTLELNGAANFKVMTGASVSVTGNSLLDASALTGTFEVQDGASISIADSALDAASLTNNGTVNVTNSTFTVTGSLANNGTISMDYTSTLVFNFNTISGNKITIDTTGYTNGFYKLMDYTGSAEIEYADLISDYGDFGDSVITYENDLYYGKADNTIGVSESCWTTSTAVGTQGTINGTDYFYGINGFSNAEDAWNKVNSDTSSITFDAGNYDTDAERNINRDGLTVAGTETDGEFSDINGGKLTYESNVTLTGNQKYATLAFAGTDSTLAVRGMVEAETLNVTSGEMSLAAAAEVEVIGTLTNGGDITLSDGSKLMAGTLTNNGSITWDLTTEASTLSDYSTVEGNGTYELSISTGLAVGDYVLAYNATGSLDGKNTFTIAGLSETGTLKINGAAFVYDGWNYRLSTRDMNSDGNADLVFSVKAEPQVAKVVSDFNKSGVSDLLAVDDNQMVSLLYDADGAFASKDVWGLGDWTLRETKGDYNGDGYADAVISYDDGTVTSVAVLKNKADADNVAFEHTDVRGFQNSEWEYLGAADVNGDGITDILTIETKGAANGDRNVNAWIMGRDGTYQSDMRVSGKNDDWEIIGFSDVTGDGKENVILSYNNEVAYWEHNGTNDSMLKNLGDITGREVLGFGDFDGDGIGDVLLNWTADDTIGMWTKTNQGDDKVYIRLGQLSDLDEGWSFAGIGDYNGDGKDDILWSDPDGKLAFSGANKDDFSKLTVIA